MIPKFSTTLLHLNAARVAAATTQTITPTFRTVLQHQSQQQAAATASSSTTVGWTAGATATSNASSNAANAKFQSGGRFYNAYQQATSDPSFASSQQDDEEKRKRTRQTARKATIRPMSHQLIRRSNPSVIIPSSRLAHARLLQTKSYPRPINAQVSEETEPESRALVLSSRRRHYSTSPGEAESPESVGTSAGSSQDVDIVDQSRSSVDASLDDGTQEVLELMRDEPESAFASTDPSAPQSVLPPARLRTPRSKVVKKLLELVSTARDPKSTVPISSLKQQLEGLINDLRRDGNRDSNTWSSVLWATIEVRMPGEDLRRSIALYNSLLSGAFIPADEELPSRGSAGGIIVPNEKIISVFIRALAIRDHEVSKQLGNARHFDSVYTPLRQSPLEPFDQEERARLGKENNFAPAMALVAATLQQQSPRSLGVITYNLLLDGACRHQTLVSEKAENSEQSGPTAGGISSAITIFAHLEKSGCRPSSQTFEKLLQIYANAGDLEGAQEVWTEFRSACARGSIDWILKEGTTRPTDGTPAKMVPWEQKAGPLHPDQPLEPISISALVGVWTRMIRAQFQCNDPAGGLAILEKMMDSPFVTPSKGTSGSLTPVDVPPPSFNTYATVIDSFLEAGDVTTAVAWFKRLLQQEPGEDDGKHPKSAATRPSYHKWLPLAAPPRPDRALWDTMCHHLHRVGAVDELNELFDYTDGLRKQFYEREFPDRLQKAVEESKAKHNGKMPEKHLLKLYQQVTDEVITLWDTRDSMHWSIAWRLNVAAMESPGLSLEKRSAYLDWVRTRMINRVLVSGQPSPQQEDSAVLTDQTIAEQEKQLSPEEKVQLSLSRKRFASVRDRAWHAVGLYITQGRLNEGIELAVSLYNFERELIVRRETSGMAKKQLVMEEETEVQADSEATSSRALQSLSNLRSLVGGLEERVWTYGSETKQYPSLKALVAQLELNNRAGIMSPMRSAWYFANAFLHYRDDPELANLKSNDWVNLGRNFAATAMSVFYEDNKPRPNPEMAWQLVTFLQILQKQGKTFEAVGRNNVFRIYKILEHHLGEVKVKDLMIKLGSGFSNPEKYFPQYVRRSGASEASVTVPPSTSQDVQAMINDARNVSSGPPKIIDSSAIGRLQSPERRSLQPLVINPGQSAHIFEGTKAAKSSTYQGNAVSAEVAYERLLAGYNAGEVPSPENIARLIVSLGHSKSKTKIIRCYEICNEVLSTLENNKTWQASAWFALEDAMVTALAHCGDMKAASIHRSRLVAQGSAPSANSYGALIANIKDTTDNAAVAIELFEESRRLGVEPTAFLYNTIISRLAKARKADYAMMLFQTMKQAGLAPTEITYGAVIAGCARIGDSTTAEILFEEMRTLPGYRPRIPPFNTMMQLYTHVKPNRDRALYYYDLMKQMGVEPTPYSYKLLLDAYGSIEPVMIPKMEEIIELMKTKNVEITGNHYSSLIISHGCSHQDLNSAIQVFENLRKQPQRAKSPLFPRGSPRTSIPDVLVYEAILNVCITHHRIDLMEQYYKMMIEQDHIRPTAYICNLLIKGWASIGNLEAARSMFEGMQDPPAGAAAPNNHAPHLTNEGVELVNGSIVGNVMDPVYREPSSWEAMVRAELSAGGRQRATALLERMKDRCYPAAITAKIEGILWEPSVTTPTPTADA